MRTFALTMILLAGAALAAAADDDCDCEKTEKVEIGKVEIETVEVECPPAEEKPAPHRPRDHFRIGITGTSEIAAQDDWWDYFHAAFANTDMFPGLFWELRLGHLGFGMTCLGRFIFDDTTLPYGRRTWYFDVIGTIDARYHFLSDSFLDPFVELGIGAAGQAMMYPVEEGGAMDMLAASIFAQAGGGLGFNFRRFHVGAKFMYRFFQDMIPCVDLPAYPVSMFQLSLFAGFSLF